MMRKWIITWMVGVMALGTGSPTAMAQFVDQGNAPAENVRNRGARSPGQMVRAGIAAHAQGSEITDTEPPDVRLQQTILVTLFENLLALLAGLVSFLPTALAPDPTPPASGDGGTGGGTGGIGSVSSVGDSIDNSIVMTEVAHNGSAVLVELLNRGPILLQLGGLRFHDGVNLSGPLSEILLDRNETKVIQLGGDARSTLADETLTFFRVQSVFNGELALFDFSQTSGDSLPIDDPDLMIDYVQWSTATQESDPPLEDTAVRAGLWNEILFVPSTLANMSFRLEASAESRRTTNATDIIVGPFADHTLGFPESQNNAAASGAPTESTTGGETQ